MGFHSAKPNWPNSIRWSCPVPWRPRPCMARSTISKRAGSCENGERIMPPPSAWAMDTACLAQYRANALMV